MKKQQWLTLINPLLVLFIVWQVGTALFRESLEEMGGETYFYFHAYTGYALAVLALAHLWLNWDWMMSRYFKRKRASSTSGNNV